MVFFAMKAPSLVSVLLPADLRVRLERQARKRALKLSTTLREIDMDEDLARAEEWQRAQVWATWERIRAGTVGERSWEEIDALFAVSRGRRRRCT